MGDGRDESWSEFTICPDGRVYVFGLTRPIMEVLATLPVREDEWQTELEAVVADNQKQTKPSGPA